MKSASMPPAWRGAISSPASRSRSSIRSAHGSTAAGMAGWWACRAWTATTPRNETSFFRQFERGRWYKLRLQVTGRYIAAWIDEEQVIYVDLGTRAIGLREGEIELSKPLGIAS